MHDTQCDQIRSKSIKKQKKEHTGDSHCWLLNLMIASGK